MMKVELNVDSIVTSMLNQLMTSQMRYR